MNVLQSLLYPLKFAVLDLRAACWRKMLRFRRLCHRIVQVVMDDYKHHLNALLVLYIYSASVNPYSGCSSSIN